jgi:hypothetical protein
MPTVWQSYPVARRIHGCTSCGRPIVPGDRYSRWTGTNDLWIGLATAKDCAECCIRYGRPIPDYKDRINERNRERLNAPGVVDLAAERNRRTA